MIPAGFLFAFLVPALPARDPDPPPASHLWVVNELFSNPDGTVQFIELWECCGSSFETHLSGKKIYSDATGHTFTFPADVTGDTANRYILLGTAAFAALPGAPTPDQILPDGFFATGGDTIRWHIYPNATLSFGAGALPLDGLHSLQRGGTTPVNSPTNYAGQSGSVNVAIVPAMPSTWLAGFAALLLLGGAFALRRR